MPSITIRGFSCIKECDIDINRINFIIGPQSSGKSVISKLIYFFNDAIRADYFNSIEAEKTFAQYKRTQKEKFLKWFPMSTWGKSPFYIRCNFGNEWIQIERKMNKIRPSETASIYFSESIENIYKAALSAYRRRAHSKDTQNSNDQDYFFDDADFWPIRQAYQEKIRETFGGDYFTGQIFIPAARSFFTSVGKALGVFEAGGYLDEVTLRFGRLFGNVRDRGIPRAVARGHKGPNIFSQKMTDIFGGKIHIKKDEEYIHFSDGRKVDFLRLSSGQQEMIPMWLILEYFYLRRAYKQILFLEEPEAHLFPKTQSAITEILASIVSQKRGTFLFINTHSPYILMHMNAIIKASQVRNSTIDEQVHRQINDLMPESAHLDNGIVNAFAIIEGVVRNIIDEDGLIDAEYLDSVSIDSEIAFNRLLEIEHALLQE